MARKHRSAAANYGRNVHSDRRHDHTGNYLIAVGNENESVKLMSHSHSLNAITDKLTACKRILHSDMSHCNSVAHSDRGDKHGRTTCHTDTCLDSVGYLIKMEMSRHYLAMSAHNADKRTLKLLLGVSHCVEQTSVRCSLRALCNVI